MHMHISHNALTTILHIVWYMTFFMCFHGAQAHAHAWTQTHTHTHTHTHIQTHMHRHTFRCNGDKKLEIAIR